MTTPPTFDPSGFSTDPNATRIEKPWGYEVLLTPKESPYAFKLIHVKAGHRLSLQEDETGTLNDVPLKPGVGYHIAIGQRHRLCASPEQDVTVFEASTPEIGTTWRLEDDHNRPHQTDEERARETEANASRP
jgi:hypothetical protein